jgi:hypothetical protein
MEAALFSLSNKQVKSDFADCSVHGAKEIINVAAAACPECGKPIVSVVPDEKKIREGWLAYPFSSERTIPKQVSDEDPALAEDYREAALLLTLSPKASAALSRRCLEKVLVKKAGVPADLNISKMIQQVLDSKTLPSYLHDNLDAIRGFARFAAHPIPLKDTGEIVDVDPGEAEYTLEILDDLFDFYYVKPARAAEMRKALDEKLTAAGKPPMKK